jgi:hypothetical protein
MQKENASMKRSVFIALVAVTFVAAILVLVVTKPVVVQASASSVAQDSGSSAVWDAGGQLQRPVGYRRWVFLGAPLTPNGLNNGKASFPEYHHVYVEAKNVDVFLKTGSFPEGTVIVKELTRVLDPTFPDGKKFPETNGWGFFNFGHHPEPYADWAKAMPATECGFCHKAYAAKTDMTWVQFYPMLRDKQ